MSVLHHVGDVVAVELVEALAALAVAQLALAAVDKVLKYGDGAAQAVARLAAGAGVELGEQRVQLGRVALRVEAVRVLDAERHAHAARLGVHAERRLEQVVHLAADVDVQARVRVAQHDVVERGAQRKVAAAGVEQLLFEARPLLQRRGVGVAQPLQHVGAQHGVGHVLQHVAERFFVVQQALLFEHLLEHGLAQALGALEARVQRAGDVRVAAAAALARLEAQVQVVGDGGALLVAHEAGAVVGDPAVDAPSARVHPQDVAKAKVVAQRGVDDARGQRHVLPVLVAHARGAHGGHVGHDVLVVGHVNVEDELLLHGRQRDLQRVLVGRRLVVHGANVDLDGRARLELLQQLVAVGEGLPADVDVAGEREGDLAVRKRVRGAEAEPAREERQREEARIVPAQLGRQVGGGRRGRRGHRGGAMEVRGAAGMDGALRMDAGGDAGAAAGCAAQKAGAGWGGGVGWGVCDGAV
ncbi:hypothetical protein FGB62_32g139 [Gracilaria domingensis]|nr:hypothetical protein FGB62_32g139 [Gracilaria domingensis]